MAPPPPATLPMQQRLMLLVQTLQFAWFCGHVTLLFCTFRYTLSYISFNYYSGWAQFSYRTAFISAAVTYGIVVYKAYRGRVRAGKATSPMSMASDENVQYLGMALIWLFSRQVGLALLPFAIYSIFHVANYVRTNLLPAVQPAPAAQQPGAKPPSPPIADAIGKFVKDYYDSSMMLVAMLEVLLWFRVLGSALLLQKAAFVLLLIYTAFFRARYSQSPFVQHAITQLVGRADAAFANQSTPPAVRQTWETAKGLTRQAVDATDIHKYANGSATSKKTH